MPIIVAAVLVAPVVEEYMFRVFLQGWLERWAFPAPNPSTEGLPVPPTAKIAVVLDGDVVDAEMAKRVPGGRDLGANPFTDATAGMLTDACPPAIDSPAPRTRWWPIVISGLLFGLAHLGQGPAPIPLVFLGLGLGYLYQRTHRILPCIVVHFLVNGTAVIQLAVYIAEQQPAAP